MQLICALFFLTFAAALPSGKPRDASNQGFVKFPVTKTSGSVSDSGDLTASVFRPLGTDYAHYYINISVGTPPQPSHYFSTLAAPIYGLMGRVRVLLVTPQRVSSEPSFPTYRLPLK